MSKFKSRLKRIEDRIFIIEDREYDLSQLTDDQIRELYDLLNILHSDISSIMHQWVMSDLEYFVMLCDQSGDDKNRFVTNPKPDIISSEDVFDQMKMILFYQPKRELTPLDKSRIIELLSYC